MVEGLLHFLLNYGDLLRGGGRCKYEDGIITTRARADCIDDSV